VPIQPTLAPAIVVGALLAMALGFACSLDRPHRRLAPDRGTGLVVAQKLFFVFAGCCCAAIYPDRLQAIAAPARSRHAVLAGLAGVSAPAARTPPLGDPAPARLARGPGRLVAVVASAALRPSSWWASEVMRSSLLYLASLVRLNVKSGLRPLPAAVFARPAHVREHLVSS